MTLPVLAITLGDVAGIGPEITAKSLLGHDDLRTKCTPVVIGDIASVKRGVAFVGGDVEAVREISAPGRRRTFPGPSRLSRWALLSRRLVSVNSVQQQETVPTVSSLRPAASPEKVKSMESSPHR